MGSDIDLLSACELRVRLQHRQLRAAELVERCLARIAERDGEMHAFVCLEPERVRREARALDAGAIRGPLHGLPLGIKDVFATSDLPTAYGSPIYTGHRPAADASCVALARGAGALVIGKTATAELATYAPAATVNPRNAAHTPGGSSSGSAAAVADRMVPFALGTQTAGSVIRPASFCGTVGYKPSFGWLARTGVRLVAESFDTIGVLARFVEDAALLVGAITHRAELLDLRVADGPIRVGICHTRDWAHADAAVGDVLEAAATALAAAGARVETAELADEFDGLGAAFESIYAYEIVQSFAHEYRAHRDALSAQLRSMLEKSAAVTAAQYDNACRAAEIYRQRLADTFGCCDVLLAPSACGEAPAGLTSTGSPVLNRGWTLLHVPCVNVPAGVGPHGLPIGLQVVGRYGDDARTLAAAAWIARVLVQAHGSQSA